MDSTSHGRAVIRWSAPPPSAGIEGYHVAYALWDKAYLGKDATPASAGVTWTVLPKTGQSPITGLSYTITGLDLKKAYIVVVRAYDVRRTSITDRISPWSSPWVYVYPTSRHVRGSTSFSDGIPIDRDQLTVSAVDDPFDGRNLTYTFYVCTNTLPWQLRPGIYHPAALREINSGISAWHRAANLLTVRGGTLNCTPDQLKLKGSLNLVVLATNVDAMMGELCGRPFKKYEEGSGCAPIHPIPGSGGRRIGDTRHIVIHRGTGFSNTSNGCTTMLRVAMHEAGHQFGLDHDHSKVKPDEDYSVMWMPDDSLCAITVHDLFAIRALYESGHYTRSYVNP